METYSAFHCHSVYSLLDGAAQLKAYFQRADELGLPSISISDHGNIHHVIDAYETAKDFKVKYVPGAELYQARQTRHDRDELERAGKATDELDQRGPLHLSVVAQNMQGFKNLVRLSSDSWTGGYYGKPRVDHELLEKHGSGLIILSGCLNGELAQALMRNDLAAAKQSILLMQDAVGKDNYYVEVMSHGIQEEELVLKAVASIAKKAGIKVIPTIDSHYVHREDAELHDISLCQPEGTKVLRSIKPSKLGLEKAVSVPVEVQSIPIEDIQVGDKVVTWSRSPRRGTMNKTGATVTAISSRMYRGSLVNIQTSQGHSSSYTPDHICVARLDSDSVKPFVVYLMRKNHQYRIGITKFRRSKGVKGLFGPIQRAKDLGADAVWILKACDTHEEVLLEEAWLGHKFNIPTLLYHPYIQKSRNSKHQIPVSEFWNRVGDNTTNAAICLRAYGRDIRYPIWDDSIDFFRMRHPQYIRACNLIDGMMVCVPKDLRLPYSGLTYDGTNVWQAISVSYKPYNGPVYSIEVDKTHTYVADEIVTHNCLGTGALQSDENRFKFYNDQFYLKSYAEMAKLFPEEWLRNTIELNEKIQAPDLELKEFQFPIYDYDGDHFSYLRELTYKGLKKQYGEITKEIEDRVEYELGVIYRMGFVDYMLIVWDIIEWCHRNGIYASARGSAAGAVVSYALGITVVDPIRFKLLFERFLIEGRKTMPDIDVDVDEDRREEVINYLRTKYGISRVANICNFSTIKARAAIRDSARVLGYEYAIGDKLANLIPPPVQGFDKTLEEAFEEVEDLRKSYETDPDAKRVLDAAKGLEGLIRQTGVHAAGVLITPGPLTDFMPVMQKPNKDGSAGPIITQWNGKQVESLGLLKIDILGLKNYSIIDKTLKSVKRRKGVELNMDKLPLDDRKTYELLCSGDTSTVFQIGASGISNLTYEIQPQQLEDLMAVIALYRPGPLGSHMDRSYLSRKNGGNVTYAHPSLKEAFEDTYGLMIYQEQILSVAEKLAGYSVMERDGLRRLVGKKEKDKIKLARGEFVDRCVSHSGIATAQANRIFDEIEFFGAYGFNRGHSAAYAYLGYQTAYLKAHFPADYMAAVISCMDDVERAGEHVNNAKRLGLEVIGPSINTSDRDFTVIDDDTIQYGMKTIQGLGDAALDKILNSERGYYNLYDWLRRTHVDILNKSLIEHLLFAGALDELMPEQDNKLTKREDRIHLLNAEAKELGSYITEHPLKGIWSFLENDITHTVAEIGMLPEKTNVMIAGLVVSKDVRYSKRDNKMFIFFQVQDLTGTIDVAAFSQSAEKYKDVAVGDIVLMRGPISHERKLIGEEEAKKSKITLYECRTPQLPEYSIGESIELRFKKKPTPYTLDKILGIIEGNPGDSYVTIRYPVDKFELTYKVVKPTNTKVKEQLEMMVLSENVL